MSNIQGYRQLTLEEIAVVNEIKALGEKAGELVSNLSRKDWYDERKLPTKEVIDQRWVLIGRTHLQEGFMALVRAVTKPTNF